MLFHVFSLANGLFRNWEDRSETKENFQRMVYAAVFLVTGKTPSLYMAVHLVLHQFQMQFIALCSLSDNIFGCELSS